MKTTPFFNFYMGFYQGKVVVGKTRTDALEKLIRVVFGENYGNLGELYQKR